MKSFIILLICLALRNGILCDGLKKLKMRKYIASQAIASLINKLDANYNMKFRIITLANDTDADELAAFVFTLTSSAVFLLKIESYESLKIPYGISEVFISKYNLFNLPETSRSMQNAILPINRYTTSYYETFHLNYAYNENFIDQKYENDVCNANFDVKSIKHRMFHLTHSNDTKIMNLYNCELFSGKSCDSKWTLKNTFLSSNNSWSSVEFLQRKTRFNHCKVQIHVQFYESIKLRSILDYRESDDGTAYFFGAEGSIIQLFSEERSVNFTLYKPNSNMTLYVEFAIGYLTLFESNIYWEQFNSFHITTPILIAPGTFVVTRGLLYTLAEKLILPFDDATWIALISTLCCGVFAIYVIMQMSDESQKFIFGSQTRYHVLRMFQIFFGLGIEKLPGRNFSRFIFMIFTMSFLVIRNAYQGKMFEFITGNVRRPTPFTVQELFETETIPILIHNTELLEGFG